MLEVISTETGNQTLLMSDDREETRDLLKGGQDVFPKSQTFDSLLLKFPQIDEIWGVIIIVYYANNAAQNHKSTVEQETTEDITNT